MWLVGDERPLIGLTTSEIRRPDPAEQIPHADAGREEMVLGVGYLRALSAAGAAPVVMPPLDVGGWPRACWPGSPALPLRRAGPDPGTYGGPASQARPHGARSGPLRARRGARGRAAGHAAALAICRGAQTLNVAHGGDLLQHLPDDLGEAVPHHPRRARRPGRLARGTVEPDSLLARALGADRLEVNSYHHQAPRRIGDGLRAVARAPDGVVEGLELPGREFVVGVQCHAEAMTDRPEQAALFGAFVRPPRDLRGQDGVDAAHARRQPALGVRRRLDEELDRHPVGVSRPCGPARCRPPAPRARRCRLPRRRPRARACPPASRAASRAASPWSSATFWGSPVALPISQHRTDVP